MVIALPVAIFITRAQNLLNKKIAAVINSVCTPGSLLCANYGDVSAGSREMKLNLVFRLCCTEKKKNKEDRSSESDRTN